MKHGISVAMIVGDEIECIEQCMESLKGFADEIVVLMDCNSTDGTREYLNGCAKVKVYENKYEGKFDFSESRNKSLKKCKYSWTFIIDGDEVLVADDLKKLKQDILLRIPNYSLLLRVRQGNEDSLAELEQHRCFATRRGGKYLGSPHNQFVPDREQMMIESQQGCYIKHIGFGNPEKSKRREARTASLLPEVMQRIESGEANQNDFYNACKMYQVLNDYENAVQVGKIGLMCFFKLCEADQKSINRYILAYGTALMGTGRWDDIGTLMKSHMRIVGETVDNQFYLFWYNYREGNMISAFMNALKYQELIEIEKSNPVNMQATLVYKEIMMDKIKMLTYYMAEKREI